MQICLNRSNTLMFGVCACALLASCARTSLNRKDQQTTGSLTVIAEFDASESFRPDLRQAVANFSHLVSSLDPDADRLICYRTDEVSVPFFDGSPPDSGERFKALAARELGPIPPRRGTHPSDFFEAIAPTIRAAGPCLIVAIGDGDEDGTGQGQADTRTRKAAAAMAANPEAVAMIEANPDNWRRIKAEFAPFGSRLHLCTPQTLSADDLIRWATDARQLSTEENAHAQN